MQRQPSNHQDAPALADHVGEHGANGHAVSPERLPRPRTPAQAGGRRACRPANGTRFDVLVIEQEASSRTALAEWLGQQGLGCRAVSSLAEARKALAERAPDLALLDHELPDGGGPQLLALLRDLPHTDIVITSDAAPVAAVIQALRLGEDELFIESTALTRLSAILDDLSVSATHRRTVRRMRAELGEAGRFGDLVGTSPAMRCVYKGIELVAPTDETVLVTGETGTGKELVAAMVHRLSRRARGPFVALNCGGVAAGLIESELFGHERGAFTGADRLRKGVFEQAEGGTLFLDEVTEMTPDMQVRLLRVLETGVLRRVGGSIEVRCDARIIASTNRDPQAAVDAGVLRRDLLYRLDVFPLSLPLLQERGEDVLLLADAFLTVLNQQHGTRKAFTPRALQMIDAWHWPGNVRELRNVVRRAWVMSADAIDVVFRDSAPEAVPADQMVTLRPGTRITDAVQQLIESTLAYAKGNKRTAANLLGISLKTLYTRLSAYAAAR